MLTSVREHMFFNVKGLFKFIEVYLSLLTLLKHKDI
jgi:hypothetical protein